MNEPANSERAVAEALIILSARKLDLANCVISGLKRAKEHLNEEEQAQLEESLRATILSLPPQWFITESERRRKAISRKVRVESLELEKIWESFTPLLTR